MTELIRPLQSDEAGVDSCGSDVERGASSQIDLLAEFLARHESACPRCGYSLRHLRNSICPECGDRLTLAVALAEPRMGAFLTTVVALSLGAGGSLLFALIAATQAPMGWWNEPAARILLLQLVLCGTALAALLPWRRRFRRAPNRAQRLLAALACALVMIMSGLIIAWFDA